MKSIESVTLEEQRAASNCPNLIQRTRGKPVAITGSRPESPETRQNFWLDCHPDTVTDDKIKSSSEGKLTDVTTVPTVLIEQSLPVCWTPHVSPLERNPGG